MRYLIRKDWLVTRWVHLMALAFGLMAVVLGWSMPQSFPLIASFCQIIYTHLVFSTNQQAAVSKADNLLLNSLPLTRDRIVAGKYLFSVLCAVLYSVYLSLLAMLPAILGIGTMMPPQVIFLMLISMGVLYHILLMPIAYFNSRYAAFASMIVYLAILILPQRIGKGISGEQVSAFLSNLSGALGGWAVPAMVLAGVLALGYLSYAVSCRLYRRAEF